MRTITKWAPLPVCLSLLLLGCNKGPGQQNAQQQPPAQSSDNQNQNPSQPAPAQQQQQPAPPPAPTVEKVTIPEGTPLAVRLVSGISSGTAAAGSEFQATLAAPLIVRGVQIAHTGSTVTGRVTNAVSSGRLNRPAELALTLTSLRLAGGRTVEISTNTWTQKSQSHKKRDAEMIGGGAGVGALIGAIAGKGKGAAIGGLVGGGAGTAGAAFTGKKEIILPAETELRFSLTAPFTFTRKVSS